ncbi:hypothetical protein [Pseudoalteromonas piscicida]|uniref:hypothetical protein n=1 Tax=Pseudoalteromonas piscicida TaxID=43662 RepID=UPI0032C0575D
MDVIAALTKAQVIQYVDLMGDELSAIELDICMGELVNHHHPDDIATACRHCLELGIGFPFTDYFLMEMTANRSEFDIEFFERTVAPLFYGAAQSRQNVCHRLLCTDVRNCLSP